MRSFIEAYSKLISSINLNKQQIYAEFNLKLNEQYTVEYLVQTFIENKRTGQERPDVAQFVEIACNPLSNHSSNQQQSLLDGNDYSLILSTLSINNTNNNSPSPFNPQQQFQNSQKLDQLDANSQLRATPPVYFRYDDKLMFI